MLYKMIQVMHLNKIEVVFPLYQFCPLIGPFNPRFAHLPTLVGGGSSGACFSVRIGNPFPQFLMLTFCLCAYSLSCTEFKENVCCSVKGPEIHLDVLECLWSMTVILSHQAEINQ